MTSQRLRSPSALAPLLAAKGRLPLLPHPHVPRERHIAALTALVRAHRLVALSAGAFAGKTTLLAEFARGTRSTQRVDDGGPLRVFWYTVDEIDDTPRVLLEGLAHAVSGTAPAGDEAHLLAHVVGTLDMGSDDTVLIVDDVHRAAACLPLIERLLRYLPPRAHLLVSGRPPLATGTQRSALWLWLEDQNQVAYVTGADLCLDDEERARFRAATGRDSGAWAVHYRRGGQPTIVAGLRTGVLPALEPELRAVVDMLAVLPVATVSLLGAALMLPEADAARLLARLREETILLEHLDPTHDRLGEAARQAALADHNSAALTALRLRAAAALEAHDPGQAAHLFAQGGAIDQAVAAARCLSWWEWRDRQALGQSVAALLPSAALVRCGGLTLVVAHRRLVEQGPRAAHALVRATHPTAPLEQIERLRLLAHCCAVRRRPWGLARCITNLEALTAAPDPRLSILGRSYGLAALGIARGLRDRYRDAAEALRHALDLLALAGATETQVAYVRLLALRAFAYANDRLGHFDEAERLYAAAQTQAHHECQPHVELEIANNRAIVLQQRGAHTRSADVLRAALASPWSAERGLRALLLASLADALDALGDRGGAAQALHDALAEVQERDVYGLNGHLHATLALLLVEGEQAAAAQAELAAGAPPGYPVTLLAKALLRDPQEVETRSALEAALAVAGPDQPLRARIRAHLARVCTLQGDRASARRWANKVVTDRSSALAPREATILGPRLGRLRGAHPTVVSAEPEATPIAVRFFGTPLLLIGGQPLGGTWWARSKGRELLWYALAHGRSGFTREEACADLFPDLDAERGGRALRNLLYELRKLLRAHCRVGELLMAVNGRLHLLPEDLNTCWDADTQTLEDWLARLRAGTLDGVGDLPVLLPGPYLADLDADWTRPVRYYWEREALHALDLAATLYERAGCPAQALACLRRAVEFSPDDAALLRRVLLLYHALDDVSGLRATYLLHRRALREELEAAPDPSVTALYETLTRS